MIKGECQMVEWVMLFTKFMVQYGKVSVVTLRKGQRKTNVKIIYLVYNVVILANCWHYNRRSMWNGSMSNEWCPQSNLQLNAILRSIYQYCNDSDVNNTTGLLFVNLSCFYACIVITFSVLNGYLLRYKVIVGLW